MKWIFDLKWYILSALCGVILAQNAKIEVQIVGLATNEVDPNLMNGIMNGTGTAELALVNATIVKGVCDAGFYWNETRCLRCACANRTVYNNTWVKFTILK
jgi:hypothetical protein